MDAHPRTIAPVAACLLALVFLTSLACGAEARLPEPTREEQQAAEKTVKETFADQYAKRTPDDQSMLALKLLAAGSATKDDPKAQYVLFREARDVAVKAGDAATAMAAVDQLAERFDVDQLDMAVKTLGALRSAARTPEVNKAVAETALERLKGALAKDSYDAALRLAEIACATARVSGDTALATQAQARSQDVTRCQAAFVNVKLAMYALTKNPNDADAKFKVGQFHLLFKDDRVTGLVYLERGSNPTWAGLAKQELAKPKESADMLKLADGYYELVPTESGAVRDRIKQLAAQWYEKALPDSSGLAKAKIEKRLKELTPAPAAGASTAAAPAPAPSGGPAASLAANPLVSERTRKALPTEAELKKFEGREQATKGGDPRKTREFTHLYYAIRARLITDPQNWNEADLLARLEAQTKINKLYGESAGYLGDTWLDDPLPAFMSSAKTAEQFAARALALEKATETLGTPTKAQVAYLLKPALNKFISRNSATLGTAEAKGQFYDWLKKQGVTSGVIDDFKSTLK